MFHTPSSDILATAREKDGVVVGVHLSFLCAELVEFFGLLGFEWLLLDAEHQPLTAHSCRDLVRAADLMEMPCIVRVPGIKAPVIESFLDVGVRGVLAPCVSSAADAEALVAAVKYAPAGRRGAAGKSRAARYGLTQSVQDHISRANQLTVTAALIETQQGVESLESIIAVPGLDYIAIGASDLGLSLGMTDGIANAKVRVMVEEARARIKACGKPQLAVVSDAPQARQAVATGAKLIAVPDAALLAHAGHSFLDNARK